ncbi:hypothetical protein [Avibacterium sp. 21-599]|uniref:hypothetical protein n=1 Tax=Avibacterium sp. 21-599 TaxID=2911528 RepID=UPI002247A6EA|nr:hypothetical protein [Avibacterium sp. 21-599]MCW9717445.1 hypothetical protein [Avibacterium sp. 21-599]
MRKLVLSVLSLGFVACQSQPPIPTVSDEVAISRLNQLERLDEKEYQTRRSRLLEGLEDEKLILQNERIHYQNQAIQYQNTRQATKDAIDDYGRILMHEANAINKSNENLSKKQDIHIHKQPVFIY